MDKISFGFRGEEIAAEFLAKQGYLILERNWRAGKVGEIDLVAQKDNTLIFVEVKTRKSAAYGQPVEAVTPAKLAHLEKAAWAYKKQHPNSPRKMLIEVVSILENDGKREIKKYQIY